MKQLISELRAFESLLESEARSIADRNGQNGGASASKWKFSASTKIREIRESLESGKPVSFSGGRKIILLFGLDRMPVDFIRAFVEKAAQGCAQSNEALALLDGQLVTIRRNAKETAWLVTLGRGDRCKILREDSRCFPCVATTNGMGHFVCFTNKSLSHDLINRNLAKGLTPHPFYYNLLAEIS